MGKKSKKKLRLKWKPVEIAYQSSNEETASAPGSPSAVSNKPNYRRYRRSQPLKERGNINRPHFNEEEYARITTPRQDVLFKKGWIAKRREQIENFVKQPVPDDSGEAMVDGDGEEVEEVTPGGDEVTEIIQAEEAPESGVEEEPHTSDESQPEVVDGSFDGEAYIEDQGYYPDDQYQLVCYGGPCEYVEPYVGVLLQSTFPGGPVFATPVTPVTPVAVPIQPVEWIEAPTVTDDAIYINEDHSGKRDSEDSQYFSPTDTQSSEHRSTPSSSAIPGTPVEPSGTPFMYPGYVLGPAVYPLPAGCVPPPPVCNTSDPQLKKRKKKKKKKKKKVQSDGMMTDDGSESSSELPDEKVSAKNVGNSDNNEKHSDDTDDKQDSSQVEQLKNSSDSGEPNLQQTCKILQRRENFHHRTAPRVVLKYNRNRHRMLPPLDLHSANDYGTRNVYRPSQSYLPQCDVKAQEDRERLTGMDDMKDTLAAEDFDSLLASELQDQIEYEKYLKALIQESSLPSVNLKTSEIPPYDEESVPKSEVSKTFESVPKNEPSEGDTTDTLPKEIIGELIDLAIDSAVKEKTDLLDKDSATPPSKKTNELHKNVVNDSSGKPVATDETMNVISVPSDCNTDKSKSASKRKEAVKREKLARDAARLKMAITKSRSKNERSNRSRPNIDSFLCQEGVKKTSQDKSLRSSPKLVKNGSGKRESKEKSEKNAKNTTMVKQCSTKNNKNVAKKSNWSPEKQLPARNDVPGDVVASSSHNATDAADATAADVATVHSVLRPAGENELSHLMSRKELASLLDNRPITEAVKKWLDTNSEEALLVPLYKSDTDEEYSDDDSDDVDSKNVYRDPLTVPSTKSQLLLNPTDSIAGGSGKRVVKMASTNYKCISKLSPPSLLLKNGSKKMSTSYKSVPDFDLQDVDLDSEEDNPIYDPMKYSKYYYLGIGIDDEDKILRSGKSHPDLFARNESEIVIHEAGDDVSECGSEDIEMIGHRYDSLNRNTHLYVNNLSLASELLKAPEDPPFDWELKPRCSDIADVHVSLPNVGIPHGNRDIYSRRYGSPRSPLGADSGVHSEESGDELAETNASRQRLLSSRIYGFGVKSPETYPAAIIQTLHGDSPLPCGACCSIM